MFPSRLLSFVLLALTFTPTQVSADPTWQGMSRRDNGIATCRQVLRGFKKNPRARRCVVFDIDNTLVDTRKRTQAAARSYGRRRPFSRQGRALKRISLSKVGYNAFQTADSLGLGKKTVQSFGAHWLNFFWSPRSFKHDGRIEKTVGVVKEAHDAKVEVFYLTGRTNRLKRRTIKQLKRLGLPNADSAHVICKPTIDVPTARFKRDVLSRMLRQRYQIGWFMSDSRSDIAAAQSVLRPGSCILVGFPVGPSGQPAVDLVTPMVTIR